MNVLKPDKKSTIKTLLRRGVSQHEIERKTKIDRMIIRKYAKELKEAADTDLDLKSPITEEVATGISCQVPVSMKRYTRTLNPKTLNPRTLEP